MQRTIARTSSSAVHASAQITQVASQALHSSMYRAKTARSAMAGRGWVLRIASTLMVFTSWCCLGGRLLGPVGASAFARHLRHGVGDRASSLHMGRQVPRLEGALALADVTDLTERDHKPSGAAGIAREHRGAQFAGKTAARGDR
jgi:hypothetical protein